MTYVRRVVSESGTTCNRCLKVKPLDQFAKDSSAKLGISYRCKSCNVEVATKWAQENKEKRAEHFRNWHSKNPGKAAEFTAAHWRRHKDNPVFRLNCWMRTVIRRCIRTKNGARTQEVFGYPVEQLITHLEKQFMPGMNWGNFGEWHIDHIRPLSSFVIESTNDPELRAAWCLTNLRPLWAKDNLKKSAKRTHLI